MFIYLKQVFVILLKKNRSLWEDFCIYFFTERLRISKSNFLRKDWEVTGSFWTIYSSLIGTQLLDMLLTYEWYNVYYMYMSVLFSRLTFNIIISTIRTFIFYKINIIRSMIRHICCVFLYITISRIGSHDWNRFSV